MTKTELKAALRNMNLMTVEEVKEKMGDAPCVTLTFYKMDGSVRVMRATRNFKFAEAHKFVTDYEQPSGQGLPYDNTLNKLVTVYDLEQVYDPKEDKLVAKGFRQVPANRMLSVVVG